MIDVFVEHLVGRGSLKDRFNSLFELVEKRMVTVLDIYFFIGGR